MARAASARNALCWAKRSDAAMTTSRSECEMNRCVGGKEEDEDEDEDEAALRVRELDAWEDMVKKGDALAA
jgi:hypothetical protein